MKTRVSSCHKESDVATEKRTPDEEFNLFDNKSAAVIIGGLVESTRHLNEAVKTLFETQNLDHSRLATMEKGCSDCWPRVSTLEKNQQGVLKWIAGWSGALKAMVALIPINLAILGLMVKILFDLQQAMK